MIDAPEHGIFPEEIISIKGMQKVLKINQYNFVCEFAICENHPALGRSSDCCGYFLAEMKV